MLLEAELKKCGLRDKQAAIYLAMLQLGPSSVQSIARKAKIARATAYVVLEELLERGLVTQYKEKRKNLFIAESPARLLRLLEEEKETVYSRYNEVKNLLPTLQALLHTKNQDTRVQYFRGKDGLQIIRNELTRQSSQNDVWYNITSADHIKTVFGNEGLCSKSRIAKRVRSKTIFTTSSPKLKQTLLQTCQKDLVERKFMEPKSFIVNAGITICRDITAIGFFTGTLGGVIIHSQSAADLLRQFFQVTWDHLE